MIVRPSQVTQLSHRRKYRLAWTVLVAVALSATEPAMASDGGKDDPSQFWRLAELSAVPACRPVAEPESAYPGLKALYVSGKGPKGTTADFFCYYGHPEGPVPKGGFPGVVLVHGGGGTAFPNYVREWIGLGFAVIHMVTTQA